MQSASLGPTRSITETMKKRVAPSNDTEAMLACVGLVLSDDVGSVHGDSLSKSSSAQPHMLGQNVVLAIAEVKVCSTSCMDVPRYWQPKSRTETIVYRRRVEQLPTVFPGFRKCSHGRHLRKFRSRTLCTQKNGSNDVKALGRTSVFSLWYLANTVACCSTALSGRECFHCQTVC